MQDVCVESVPIIVIYELILERHHADIYCHRSDVRQQTLKEFENRHVFRRKIQEIKQPSFKYGNRGSLPNWYR